MIPDTQRASYEAIKPHRATLQEKVLAFIVEQGGATDERIASALSLRTSSATARRNELMQAGHVVDRGFRAMSTANRSVIVWKATDQRIAS